MKTLLFIVSSTILGLSSIAQDIEIYHEGTTADISGTTVNGSGDQVEMNYFMDIKNNTNESLYLKVVRSKIEEPVGALDYFCWGSDLSGDIWSCYNDLQVNPFNPWTSVDSFNFTPGNIGFLWSYHNPEGDQSEAVYRYYITHNGIALDSVDVQYNAPLSINQENPTNIKVYPNPANHILTVDAQNISNNGTIAIYDISGKEVFLTSIGNGKNQLDIEKLKSGIYFYAIHHNSEAIEVKKLIIL